jgi:hypothetical protein
VDSAAGLRYERSPIAGVALFCAFDDALFESAQMSFRADNSAATGTRI